MGQTYVSNNNLPFLCVRGIYNFTKLIYLVTTFKTSNWFLWSIPSSFSLPSSSLAAPNQTCRLRPQDRHYSHMLSIVVFLLSLPSHDLGDWTFFLVSFTLQFCITRIFIQFYLRSSAAIQMSKERFSVLTAGKTTALPSRFTYLRKTSLPSNYQKTPKKSREATWRLASNSE